MPALTCLALRHASAQSSHYTQLVVLPSCALDSAIPQLLPLSLKHVTGLVAQQQCVGPLQLPIADVAVMAQTHFGLTGAATAIGEQPLKGLIDAPAMARLALGEALTNLVWAAASDLADVKASVNWM